MGLLKSCKVRLSFYFLLLLLFFNISVSEFLLKICFLILSVMTQKASSKGPGSLYTLNSSAPCVWASHCNSDLFLLFIWDVELAPCNCDLFFWHLFFLTLFFFLLSRIHLYYKKIIHLISIRMSCANGRLPRSLFHSAIWFSTLHFSTLLFDFLSLFTVANSSSFHQTWTQLPRNTGGGHIFQSSSEP